MSNFSQTFDLRWAQSYALVALGCCFFLSGLLGGCKSRAVPEPQSETTYALNTGDRPALTQVYEQIWGRAVYVCVVSFGSEFTSSQIQAHKKWTVDAFKAWRDALFEHPSFRGRKKPSLYVKSSRTLCDFTFRKNRREFSVVFFSSARAQVNTMCSSQAREFTKWPFCSVSENYSSADIATKSVIISPKNGYEQRSPSRYAVTVLHEVGHLLGLFDVYGKIYSGGTWKKGFEGEPPVSVMSYKSNRITDDDRAGVWAAYQFVRIGRAACQGRDKTLANYTGYQTLLFCEQVGGLQRRPLHVP